MPDAIPQRLLLVRRRYLGDLVLLDPLLRSLRAAFPKLYLALLTDAGYAEVLAQHPALDRIVGLPSSLPGQIGTAFALRRLGFDTCLNLSPGPRTAWLTFGIPRRIGFQTEGTRRPNGVNEPLVRPASFFRNHPILDLYAELLPALGVKAEPTPCRFFFPEAAREEAAERLRRAFPCSCRPFVLIHPGARLPARRWPEAGFAEAVARLQAENRADLLLVSGPGEEALLADIAALLKAKGISIPALSGLSLDLFAALCGRAAVYLGNDTGSMHVAAATLSETLPEKGKIVALFGSQSATVWAPSVAGTGRSCTVLQPSLPCGAACVAPGRCDPANDYATRCIARIGVDEVVAAVLAAL